jgi:anti-sigma-K factor RskA
VTFSPDHDEQRERAAAYALGILSAEERLQFEAHLSACDECAAEVRSLGPVVAALAHAAPAADPPEGARGRVLARLSQGSPTSAVPRATREPRRSGALAPWLLAAASLVLAAGLAAYSVSQRGRIEVLEQTVRDARARADVAERQAADARSAARAANNDEQAVIVVLAASDLMRVELDGQPVAPQASARAFWSRSQGLVFTASNLPPLPAGRTYQLWIVTAESPIGAGLLKPRTAGGVNVVYSMPGGVTRPVAFAVTIEPEGGVPAPTGDKYLVGVVRSSS